MEATTQTAPRAPADMNARLAQLLDEAEQGSLTPPPDTASAIASGGAAGTDVPPSSDGIGDGTATMPTGGASMNMAWLTALPTLMENLSPLLGRPPSSGGERGEAPRQERGAADTAVVRTATGHRSLNRHTALLSAIKPYLSSDRQAATDTVIRLCRIWDTLEQSGISPGGILSSISNMSRTATERGAASSSGCEAVADDPSEKEVR